jgi:heme-degrading monooxygenase HmoA
VVRWRTQGEHHGVQEKGRFKIFEDYQLSVGEIKADTDPPKGLTIEEKRFDETAASDARLITIVEITPKQDKQVAAQSDKLPTLLGLATSLDGCIDVEVFESLYNPGKLLLLGLWRDSQAARRWSPRRSAEAEKMRYRHVRIIRDYGEIVEI